MDYQQAIDHLAKPEPKREHHMLLSFGYSSTYVLPHKEALIVLAAFEKAQRYSDGYNSKPPVLEYISEAELKASPISPEELQTIRIAQLMQLPISEVRAMKTTTEPMPF